MFSGPTDAASATASVAIGAQRVWPTSSEINHAPTLAKLASFAAGAVNSFPDYGSLSILEP